MSDPIKNLKMYAAVHKNATPFVADALAHIEAQDKCIAELEAESDNKYRWCPDVCPFTKRPFFMWIEHQEKGWVPTYGGPFDSYTLPEADGNGSFIVSRFDHDEGAWLMDCDIDIGLRLIDDQRDDHEYGTVAALESQLAEASKDAARYRLIRDRNSPLESHANDAGLSAYHRVGEVRELKWGEELDAAIDAAMQGSAK